MIAMINYGEIAVGPLRDANGVVKSRRRANTLNIRACTGAGKPCNDARVRNDTDDIIPGVGDSSATVSE